MNRYQDWLKQAEKDIEAAKVSMNNKHFEWACFQSQQSAEKALKSLLLFMNIDVWGHGLVHLIKKWKELKEEEEAESEKKNSSDNNDFQELLEQCQELDRHYIQPRYPNGFASGYPAEYYNNKNAKECINYAENIIKFVKEKIKEISSSK